MNYRRVAHGPKHGHKLSASAQKRVREMLFMDSMRHVAHQLGTSSVTLLKLIDGLGIAATARDRIAARLETM